ncbi:MAG: asparagine--tRNA ligase [Firmicutes bacterium]|nr:asparagine--tRNA ligase [Bacillota bacterium]
MDLIDVFKTKKIGDKVKVEGWVRNNRDQKEFGFIDFYDGTSINTLQIVYTKDLANFDEVSKILVGSAISAEGTLVESNGKQAYELKPETIEVIGDCPADYPIQPKRHTMEFLRSQAYLRPRTKTFQAVFKIRSVAASAIHEYFQSHNYVYVHTPLLTTADCEGSDQMFKVTTLDMNNVPKTEDGKADFSKDLFGKQTYITGSGQLHGETYAMAFKKIYTFGPTFRTENSNTKTHANEFWMIEPEMAFMHLDELMNVEEEMLKSVIKTVLDRCMDELTFLDNFVQKGLIEKLKKVVDNDFVRITHHDAIKLLLESGEKWEFTPSYDDDIAKEHEKWITEHFGAPVFIYNWPKDIKAWYMKLNDDGKTVAAVDLEVPLSGELMGGSEREVDLDKLEELVKIHNVDREQIEWYLNLRKFGGCYHSGFGMGFERLIMYLTGIENIRDVIPYPRTPGSCEY